MLLSAYAHYVNSNVKANGTMPIFFQELILDVENYFISQKLLFELQASVS
jgi:hypothetical protein